MATPTKKPKNSKKTLIKAAIDLISEGSTKEAMAILGNNFSEAEFISNLTVSRYTPNVFNFVKEFKDPDWHIYASKMNSTTSLDFIHLAKKNNIDLLKKNKNGDTIIDVILTNTEQHEKTIVFEAVDSETITKAFLSNDTYPNVVRWFRDANYYNNSYEKKNLPSITETLLSKLNNAEVRSSENCKKLLCTRNDFSATLLNMPISNLNKLFDTCGEFFGDYAKKYIDTKLIMRLGGSNDLDKETIEAFNKIIQEKSFSPDYVLLADDWKDALVNGRFDLINGTERYRIFKDLVANDLLPSDKFNNPDNNNFTTFERFLVKNLQHANFKDKDIPKVISIIQEAEKLTELGFEKKCVIWEEKNIRELLDNSFSRRKRFDMDEDVEELAWRFHLPPPLIQELVEFFDKRYGYTPEKNIEADNQKEEMKQAWENLMSQVTFTVKPKQEKSQTMKP